MAIDLDLPTPDKLVKKSYELPESVAKAFALYVEAARETADNATDSVVLVALIERQLRKDRKFKAWLAARASNADSDGPSSPQSDDGSPVSSHSGLHSSGNEPASAPHGQASGL